MIILDNSVLSAFKKLERLHSLKKLIKSAAISEEIFSEFTNELQQEIPNWIKILKPKQTLKLDPIPASLSSAEC